MVYGWNIAYLHARARACVCVCMCMCVCVCVCTCMDMRAWERQSTKFNNLGYLYVYCIVV